MNTLTPLEVLVFGYSENPERYSFLAFELLNAYNHKVTPFNPRIDDISKVKDSFHTLTLYVNPVLSKKYTDDLLNLKLKRVIFNPGTENQELIDSFHRRGVEVVIGCTLVMLRTNQF